MRIFFAGSSSGLPASRSTYTQILEVFESLGHQILPNWIVSILRNSDHYTSSSPRNILAEQQALIRQSDLMVVECNKPSFGIGFLIHQALQERVPILCLYPEGADMNDISDMIAGSNSSLMHLKQYNHENLNQILVDFCQSHDTDDLHKFNFIASREVLDYIEEGSKKAAKSKSEFLRDEITKVIRSKDQE